MGGRTLRVNSAVVAQPQPSARAQARAPSNASGANTEARRLLVCREQAARVVRRWQCGQPRARGVRQSAGARWRERRRLVARDGQEGSRISRISVVARSFLVAAEAERCVATAQAEVRVCHSRSRCWTTLSCCSEKPKRQTPAQGLQLSTGAVPSGTP